MKESRIFWVFFYFICILFYFISEICKFIHENNVKFSQRIILCDIGGINIWYLWDCQGREETKMLALCRKHLSDAAAKDIFVLTYDRMRRYEGVWHVEKKLLFPSYIFLDSGDGMFLSDELKRVQSYGSPRSDTWGYGITKRRGRLIRVDEDAERFLKFLFGNQYHLEMSHGVIKDGITRITEGPLKGMEQRIGRIDRHKRLAKLLLTVNRDQRRGKKQDPQEIGEQDFRYITAGLEITEKNV
jgi:transcriptional antiterminator NusG